MDRPAQHQPFPQLPAPSPGDATHAMEAAEEVDGDMNKDIDKDVDVDMENDMDKIRNAVSQTIDQQLFRMRTSPPEQAALIFKKTSEDLLLFEASIGSQFEKLWPYAETFDFARHLGYKDFQDLKDQCGGAAAEATNLPSRPLKAFRKIQAQWGADFYTYIQTWPVPVSQNIVEKVLRLSKVTHLHEFAPRINDIIEKRVGSEAQGVRQDPVLMLGDVISYEDAWPVRKRKNKRKGREDDAIDTDMDIDIESLTEGIASVQSSRSKRAKVGVGREPPTPEMARHTSRFDEHAFQEDSDMAITPLGGLGKPMKDKDSLQVSPELGIGHSKNTLAGSTESTPASTSLIRMPPVDHPLDLFSPRFTTDGVYEGVFDDVSPTKRAPTSMSASCDSSSGSRVELPNNEILETSSRAAIDLPTSSPLLAHQQVHSLQQQIVSAEQNLASGKKLNDVTVWICLRYAAEIQPTIGLLDSHFFHIENRNAQRDKMPRHFARRNPPPTVFLAPLHFLHDEHWCLVWMDLKHGVIDFYDPLISWSNAPRRFKEATACCETWMRRVKPELGEVQLNQKACAQQRDGVSCGLFCIAFGLALLEGKPAPGTLTAAEAEELRLQLLADLRILAKEGARDLHPDSLEVNLARDEAQDAKPDSLEVDFPNFLQNPSPLSAHSASANSGSDLAQLPTPLAALPPLSDQVQLRRRTTKLKTDGDKWSNTATMSPHHPSTQVSLDPSIAVVSAAMHMHDYWNSRLTQANSKLAVLNATYSDALERYLDLCRETTQTWALGTKTRELLSARDLSANTAKITSASGAAEEAHAKVAKCEKLIIYLRGQVEKSEKVMQVLGDTDAQEADFEGNLEVWAEVCG